MASHREDVGFKTKLMMDRWGDRPKAGTALGRPHRDPENREGAPVWPSKPHCHRQFTTRE